ncbi:MAG: SDR family oxidoreductase [Clostridia bacterium]|nr:SDR family oxidoreductase [Clostridia bacterium]
MKTAIISGASRGIGRAIAISLAKEGYAVIVGYCHNKDKSKEVCDLIIKEGGIAEAYRCDVSVADDVKAMVEYVKAKYSTIDAVIANAGIGAYGMLIDHSDETIMKVVNTNLVGCITLCREVGRVMLSQKNGSIVTLSSMWGQVGGSCESVYSATKGGIIAFSKALAKEFAPNGVRVNCVAPGFIDTDINSNLTKDDIDSIIADVPLGRAGTPQDVANAVAWLVSEKASYVTGQVLSVNGGLII